MVTLGKKKKKMKKRFPQSDSSDSEHSSDLMGVFSEIRGVFWNTWIQKGVVVPLNYRKLAGISSNEEETNLSVAVSNF